ncbi:ABC transporter permease [Microbulbifer sediminum]|uniref:ABC transporter permease n=1 Tax=Microbulbifer sediminum TaxID=2904250 RepID=UPI001F1FE5AB|nr:iron ABC transporter permease [Microbulbifer sediminum]
MVNVQEKFPAAGADTSARLWLILVAAVSLLVALPVLAIFWLAFFPEENIWPHLLETVFFHYVSETLVLAAGVGFFTLVTGVGAAWLVTMCRFPGRGLFEWALLLPFAVPAYVIAYVYTDLLEFAGPVQGALRDWFGWQTARDYWFPEIRSMGGAIAMLSLVLYPYVYMLSRAAFLEQCGSIRAASRALGCSPWQSFRRVSLPMARPAIAVGLSLVLMETLNDFGTVDFFAVRTLSVGIYDTWLSRGNLGGAAQIACSTLVFVVLLISLERLGRARQRHYVQSTGRTEEAYQLRGGRAWLASGFCLLVLAGGFGVPLLVLGSYALGNFASYWTDDFIGIARNSFALSFGAAACTALLGLLLAYGKRLFPTRTVRVLVGFARLGYAMPGAVMAIGVLIPLGIFDNTLDAFMRSQFGISTGLLLSGTVFAILFAYTARFLAVSAGAAETSLEKVTPSMDRAARALGRNSWQTLWYVHLPLIRAGLLSGALVVFVDCMKELPATLLLRPFGFETLATYVYQFASDEMLERSALGALMIVLVGLLPVILLSRSMGRAHRGDGAELLRETEAPAL